MTQFVTMNRDMRPFRANGDYAVPDDVAARLIAEKAARPGTKPDGDGVTFLPDAVPEKPRTRFLTRGKR